MKLRTRQPEYIHSLKTVEAAGTSSERSEHQFDPLVEFNSHDWNRIIQELESYRVGNFSRFTKMATQLVTLFPERRDELNLGDVFFRRLHSALVAKKETSLSKYTDLAKYAVILFPDHRQELGIQDDQKYLELRKTLQTYRNNKEWWPFATMAESLLLLYPERRKELGLDDEAFQEMKNNLLSWDSSGSKFNSLMAYILSLLYPSRRAELKIDDEAFQEMKKHIDNCRSVEDWYMTLFAAEQLAVLTADDLKISHNGIELIYRSRFLNSPELPPRNLAA